MYEIYHNGKHAGTAATMAAVDAYIRRELPYIPRIYRQEAAKRDAITPAGNILINWETLKVAKVR